jgi:hypothetical protein
MSEWQIATASSVTSTSAGSGIAQDDCLDGQRLAEFMADRGTDFARHLSLPEACSPATLVGGACARKPDFAIP